MPPHMTPNSGSLVHFAIPRCIAETEEAAFRLTSETIKKSISGGTLDTDLCEFAEATNFLKNKFFDALQALIVIFRVKKPLRRRDARDQRVAVLWRETETEHFAIALDGDAAD